MTMPRLGRRSFARRLALVLSAAAVGAGGAPGPGGPRAASSGKVRTDATVVPATTLATLEAAVQDMMDRSARDANDPKGWLVNARAHRDFCSIAQSDPMQIHFCWWFLSWHRAFLTITERKLRELSGDSSLSLPYWNWSSDRRIPAIFEKQGSPLATAVRDLPNRGLVDGEVDYLRDNPELAKLGVGALNAKAFTATRAADIASSFGGIARPNREGRYGNNRLEGVPHGPVHNYVGGDMGDFATAARDPIFFAHHGNLDRLWEIWRADPARKATEPTGREFTEHPFAFTWLDGTTTVITARETLDTTRLDYGYDSMSVFRGTSPPLLEAAAADRSERLPSVASAKVTLPAGGGKSHEGRTRYSLVISDITPPTRPMTVEVRIKRASDDASSLGILVGTFAAVLSGGRIAFPDTTLRYDVTDAVQRLETASYTVNLVPLALGKQPEAAYPPLRYRRIAIVRE